jgi:trans-aconitate 2-methyltransferase
VSYRNTIALARWRAAGTDGRRDPGFPNRARSSTLRREVSMSTWDYAQYAKFADERTRPSHELLARVPLEHAARVLDLGCGPGNSTAVLRARWPSAQITGVDNSPELLRQAKHDWPSGDWVLADLRGFQSETPVDLLFANAVMQWLPDHAALFPELFARLRPGGVLAVQMPHNFEQPSHRLMREVPGPWRAAVAQVRSLTPVAEPAFYYDLLAPHATLVDIWQTDYQHVMRDSAAIVEWVKGTGLRPYLDAVPEAERANYLTAYASAIDEAYATRSDGKRLFAFPRLFIVAVRS